MACRFCARANFVPAAGLGCTLAGLSTGSPPPSDDHATATRVPADMSGSVTVAPFLRKEKLLPSGPLRLGVKDAPSALLGQVLGQRGCLATVKAAKPGVTRPPSQPPHPKRPSLFSSFRVRVAVRILRL